MNTTNTTRYIDTPSAETPYRRANGAVVRIGDATPLGALTRVLVEREPKADGSGGYFWGVVSNGASTTVQYGDTAQHHYRRYVRDALIAPGPAGTVLA